MIAALVVLAFCGGLLIKWAFDEELKEAHKTNNKKNKSSLKSCCEPALKENERKKNESM
jgi:hypothetical protein